MNLSLSKKLNEIVEQYIPTSPGLSESIIEWFNDWQRETSAVDHADLKAEIQDLKLDIKDLRIELKDEIHALERNTSERFNTLEKSTLLIRSEMQEQLHQMEKNTSERFASLEKNTSERFASLEKTINVNFKWIIALLLSVLGVFVYPHIQTWFQR